MTRSMEIRRDIGDFQGLAHSYNMLAGLNKMTGQLDISQEYFAKSLAICRTIGDQFGMSSNLSNLGTVARARGEFEDAKRYLEEGVQLFDEIGVPHYLVASAAQLALTYVDLGDLLLARQAFARAVDVASQHGKQEGYVFTLVAAIALAHADNQQDHARDWLAFINTVPESYATLSDEIDRLNGLMTTPSDRQKNSAKVMTEDEKLVTFRTILNDARMLLLS